MRRVVAFAVGSAVAVFISLAYAGDGKEAAVRDLIDQKVTLCQMKAQRIDSRGKNVRAAAEKASSQAEFYMKNKEELVQQIFQQNESPKPYEVSYFLIKTYNEAHCLAAK